MDNVTRGRLAATLAALEDGSTVSQSVAFLVARWRSLEAGDASLLAEDACRMAWIDLKYAFSGTV